MLVLDPGCPDCDVIATPANFPESILSIEDAGISASSLFVTAVIEPVLASLRIVPYPTTTTSSSSEISGSIVTRWLGVADTSTVVIPTSEMTSVLADAGTESEYLPLASVTVPCEVPLTITLAPITASPSSEDITVPEAVLV